MTNEKKSMADAWMTCLNRWSIEGAHLLSELTVSLDEFHSDPWWETIGRFEKMGFSAANTIYWLVQRDPKAALQSLGHPDDVTVAREILSLREPLDSELMKMLDRHEKVGSWVLQDLERLGWTYCREGVRKGHLEPIGGHPAHGGGKGRVPDYMTTVIWSLCYVKEMVNLSELDDSDAPWVKYRVRNRKEFRQSLARFLNKCRASEPVTDAQIKSAIYTWRKRKGEPPPWMQLAE